MCALKESDGRSYGGCSTDGIPGPIYRYHCCSLVPGNVGNFTYGERCFSFLFGFSDKILVTSRSGKMYKRAAVVAKLWWNPLDPVKTIAFDTGRNVNQRTNHRGIHVIYFTKLVVTHIMMISNTINSFANVQVRQ